MRAKVERILELDGESPYRVLELDGKPVDCWLPGLEPNDPEGPLDRGGFESKLDANAFRLGVDRERALHGLISGVKVEDVDRERADLDNARTINGTNRRKTPDNPWEALLPDTPDDAQLDLEALSEAVSEPAAPVVVHRRPAA